MNYYIAGNETGFTRGLDVLLQKAGHVQGRGDIDFFIFSIHPAHCGVGAWEKLLENYAGTAELLLAETGRVLPKMQNGKKRLCFLTQTSASINETDTAADAVNWEKTILAACNMAVATLFNRLGPEGFTFRLYAAENFETENPSYALTYFLADRSMEEESHRHSDEKRLVMRNWQEKEIPW